MFQTTEWLSQMIVRELETFERELALFPNGALVWQTAPGVTNSAGNLALHVCGNLQWFIGSVLGQTGYVRDREAEFSARNVQGDRLVAEIHRTIEVVRTIMPRLTDAQLRQPYPEAVGGVRMVTGMFVTHLAVHAAFHLGQAGYLRRVLTGENKSAGPVPLAPLAMGAVDQ